MRQGSSKYLPNSPIPSERKGNRHCLDQSIDRHLSKFGGESDSGKVKIKVLADSPLTPPGQKSDTEISDSSSLEPGEERLCLENHKRNEPTIPAISDGVLLDSTKNPRLVAKTKKMKKTFRCAVCLRTFAKKAKLMKHRSSHSPQELLESGFDENTEGLTLPHQCCFCKNRFPSKNQLRLHNKSCAIRKSKLVKQQPQQVKCSACNVNVKVKNLRSHQLRCTKFIALSDANKNV